MSCEHGCCCDGKQNKNHKILNEKNTAILSILLFIVSIYFKNIYLYIIVYIFIGYEVLWLSVKNTFKKDFFDENFLMSLATFGAIYLNEWNEAIAVMLLYQIGESLQSYAVNKSRNKINAILNIRPDHAILENGEEIDAKDVEVGTTLLIKAGEKIPLDGIVIDGNSTIDTSALTGESMPRDIDIGAEILSGSINLSGVLKIKTTKVFEKSTASLILELVENAEEKKAKTEKFIKKFSKYYTPFVVISACILAFKNINTAIIFLVISCPCALVISIPLSFFAGLGCASKNGILIKGSNYIEELAKAEYIAFDKTGTITKGNFEIVDIKTSINKDELLKNIAHVEMFSNHPIAKSIVKSYNGELNKNIVKDVEEIKGVGIFANVDGKRIFIKK
jgi:Cd2+/Zn2+-exporting ATPase